MKYAACPCRIQAPTWPPDLTPISLVYVELAEHLERRVLCDRRAIQGRPLVRLSEAVALVPSTSRRGVMLGEGRARTVWVHEVWAIQDFWRGVCPECGREHLSEPGPVRYVEVDGPPPETES